jgi:MFS family permease
MTTITTDAAILEQESESAAVITSIPPQVPPEAAVAPARRRLGRTYWSMWSAASVSSLGDGLAVVGFPLLAAAVTRRPTLVAGVVFAQRLPWLLCALPMGAIADRLPRFRTMAAVDLVRFLIVGAVGVAALSGHVGLLLLYAAACALGVLETLFSASANAAVPAAVAKSDLDRANGYLFASQTAGEQLAGPAVGGALYAMSASVPFIGDAISFAASAALLLGPARGEPDQPRPHSEARRRLWTEMREGLRTFWRHPALRVLSTTVGGMAFCQSMVLGILVLYGLEDLHLSHVGYGLFLAAGAIGNVLGALAASRVRARFGTAVIILVGGVVAAVAYLGAGATSSPVPATALFAVEACAVACGTVASMSLRQSCVAPELLGRIGNIYRMVIWGIIPIGTLAGGIVASGLGIRAAFFVAGAAQLLVLACVGGRLRRIVAAAERPVLDLRGAGC